MKLVLRRKSEVREYIDLMAIPRSNHLQLALAETRHLHDAYNVPQSSISSRRFQDRINGEEMKPQDHQERVQAVLHKEVQDGVVHRSVYDTRV